MRAISRAEAKAAGLKRYFTGKPCKHGHVDERYVCDGACRQCATEATLRRKKANPEMNRRLAKAWARANPEKVKAAGRKRYVENRDQILAQKRERYAADEEVRRKLKAEAKAWNRANPAKINEHNQRRRARKRDALCDCCASADFQSVYDLASLAGFEVDHIEPLALGGKHCRRNLQLLTPDDHRAKTASDLRRIADAKRANKGVDE